MRQVLFTIPILGVRVFGFGAMMVLAFISSTWLARGGPRRELDPEVVMDMSFWVVFFWAWLERGSSTASSIGDWRSRVCGTLCSTGRGASSSTGESWVPHSRFSSIAGCGRFLRPYMDVMAPSIAIGILFGRVGCFLNGCCYGDACQFPWAVSFPKYSPAWSQHVDLGMISRDAATSLPVHPTQIYAAIDGLVLLLLLSAFYPFRRRHGEVMALLMVTYPVSGSLSSTCGTTSGILRWTDDLTEHQRGLVRDSASLYGRGYGSSR